MAIELLDGTLIVEIDYEPDDREFTDNICLVIYESCPADEKIMVAGETHVYVTPEQANQLAACLLKAAGKSKHAEEGKLVG